MEVYLSYACFNLALQNSESDILILKLINPTSIFVSFFIDWNRPDDA